MILGTIAQIDNVAGLKLIIDGEDEPTTKKYHYMASYVPQANDRVIIEEISGSYVVMGKVISDYDDSGKARVADTATNANHATSANTATTATNATNAANATNATNATTADSLSNSRKVYGALVTGVTTGYNAQIGNYVSSVSITPQQMFIAQ